MRLGQSLEDNSEFNLNTSKFLRTHTFIQGMTGSGKTNVIFKIHEGLTKDYPEVQKVYFDDQEEFVLIPEQYPDVTLVSAEATPNAIKVERARELGFETRKRGRSVVIKLPDIKDRRMREEYIAEFLDGFNSLGKKVGTPFVVFIDEADLFVPTNSKSNVSSREPIIDLLKRGRKFNISVVLATQYSSEVDIRARRECANRIIGKATELRDRRAVSEMLGDSSIIDEFWELDVGQFFVRGDALSKKLSKIQVDESLIEKTVAGVTTDSIKPPSSELLEYVIVNKDARSTEEILYEKIKELEDELKISKTKELTDDSKKSIYEMGYNEGFKIAKEQADAEKCKITKIFRRGK